MQWYPYSPSVERFEEELAIGSVYSKQWYPYSPSVERFEEELAIGSVDGMQWYIESLTLC